MKKISIILALLSVFLIPLSSNADVWQKDVIDSTGTANGFNCSIALDSQGYPHLSYCNLDELYLHYAYYDGTQWHITTVDSLGITGLHTSLALDSLDRPHIAYTAHIMNLRYVFMSDTGWVNKWVDSGVNPGVQGFRTSLALDNNDKPHIAYVNDDSGWVVYATQSGDDWDRDFIQDITSSVYLKLILKDDSIAYIGYHVFDSSVTADTLRIAYQDPSKASWQFADVPEDVCPSGIFYHSFDMDSQGNCYFAYETPYGGLPICSGMGDKKIAMFNGTTWSLETVPNPSPDPYEIYPTFPLYLKMDNNDNPAFLADTILYWKKDGITWTYYGLGNQMGDEVAVYQQLAFDDYNYPNMVFGDPWVVYYKLYPGDPQIVVPVTSHTYTQNYETWNCVIENQGEAPLIVDSLVFKKTDSIFQVVFDKTPFYIHSMQSDSVSIRFMPEDEITHYDTLQIYNNDSANLVVDVTLEGTGSFDDTTGSMLLQVQDCYASPEYHAINYDQPLEGVSIALYQAGELKYGPIISDQNGAVLQSEVIPGSYDMEILKIVSLPYDESTILDTLRSFSTLVIDTGLNADTLVLPESLMVQSYQWVHDLSHIEEDEAMYVYGAEAYGSGSIRNMLDLWINNLDSNKIESASRLILAQEMVDQMFSTGRLLGRKGFEGVADLLHFGIKATEESGGWAIKLLKIIKLIWDLWAGDKMAAVMEMLQMLAEYIILELLDMVVDQVSNELPNLYDPMSGALIVCGGDILKAVWKDIKYNYSSWPLPEGNSEEELETSWNHLNNLVYNRARIAVIQLIYIDLLTNPKLEKAKEKSEAFEYTSDFPTASEESADKVLQMKVLADNLNYSADQMMLTAQLLMKTYIALTLVSGFVPGLDMLETLKTITMYASIALDVSATGVALGGFFNIPGDMNGAVNVIYHPDLKRRSPPLVTDGLPKAKANAQVMAMLKQRITMAVEEYDSILTVVDDHIASHEIEDAMIATRDLALADVNLMRTIDVSTAPAYAVAHALYDSIPGFSSVFDGYIDDGALAGMTRFFNYLSLVQLPADSSQAMMDYLSAHLDTASINNHSWSDNAIELLDSIFGVEIPAIVVASEASQDKFGLYFQDDTAMISVVVQNVGALTADSVSIIFETNNGIAPTTKADSIYIGSLAPGEQSATYKWAVTVTDTTYKRGDWTVDIKSPNSKTYSPDGSFMTLFTAPLDVEEDPDNFLLPDKISLEQNHPNPFNLSTRINFSVPTRQHTELKIYNLLGRTVKTLVDKELSAGNYTITWDGTDSRGEIVASGIYLYTIKAGDQSESKKMILIK